ncbi:MAG: hypothetical protein WD733_13115, partial [Bryobacterales bacterium]
VRAVKDHELALLACAAVFSFPRYEELRDQLLKALAGPLRELNALLGDPNEHGLLDLELDK